MSKFIIIKKIKDFRNDIQEEYFYKVVENIGGLSEALRRDFRLTDNNEIEDTVEEKSNSTQIKELFFYNYIM